MKKIQFGYSNDMNPKGSCEGIGLKENLPLFEADYYGTIKYENVSYLIAKVTNNTNPEFNNKFIVRPAIADLYPDGSGTIFLDQEQAYIAKNIEEVLNKPEIKEKIKNQKDILNLLSGAFPPDRSFTFLTMDDSFVTTSIIHEAFERKHEALLTCHNSFSELQEQLNEYNYTK